MEDLGHSELFFTDYRDHWYNKDFMDLMARRWGLDRYSTMLDVGCGLCHWSRLLVPYLKPGAKVTGYDNAVKWALGNSTVKSQFEKLQTQIDFVKGDAHHLPFDDNSFDVVTCQTVLIHLEAPQKALHEMKRVLRPGGIVICAEPNNVAGYLVKDSLSKDNSIDEKLQDIKYAILWEQGKVLLKEGDNSFGDLLTGVMNEVGFTNLQSYLSDKVVPLYPPYTKAEQIAMVETFKLWEKEKDTMLHIGRKYFEVMGPEALKLYEERNNRDTENKVLRLIESNSYYSGGAVLMYLVSGSK
jgi:ubiquinone/menaquinone biosynthesis C-methylase UbiE